MKGSLRSQAMIWYAVWLVMVFVVTGTLVHLVFRHYLEATLAASQRSRATRIAGVARRALDAGHRDLHEAMTTSFAPEATSRFVAVSDANGMALYRSGPPQDQSFDPVLISDSTGKAGTRKLSGTGPGELMLTALQSGDGPRAIWVATGESMVPLLVEQRRFLVFLCIVFGVVGGVALLGGRLLVDRALRPVGELTRSAETITSRNLSERLPEPGSDDEFAELSRALNRMITRLDEAFQHNRRFLDDASHELRTPLTILRAELEALTRETGPGRIRDTAASLLDEVERLGRLVENLFALSRLDAGRTPSEWRRMNLSQLAASTAEQMRLLADDKGLTLKCDSPVRVIVGGGVWIDGDRARLKQVVVNLLDNAFKYTPRGGTVSVSVVETDAGAVLEVADTGIGIPAEALSRVFDRFFRVDLSRSREPEGTGIGLSIVRAICSAHRGRVEVESVEGRGSCFRVILPAAAAPTKSETESLT